MLERSVARGQLERRELEGGEPLRRDVEQEEEEAEPEVWVYVTHTQATRLWIQFYLYVQHHERLRRTWNAIGTHLNYFKKKGKGLTDDETLTPMWTPTS